MMSAFVDAGLRMLRQLIDMMADGKFHSGEVLGRQLGLTRAAVWKSLRRLEASGYPLERVRGQGYRIPAQASLLDPGRIREALPAELSERIDLRVLDEIDSTNAEVLRALAGGQAAQLVCMAEAQTAGRGRRGRQWESPFAQNIYLSKAESFGAGAAALEGLSLAVGVAVVRALRRAGYPDVTLKWPNDVLWRGRKLAGILVELSGDLMADCTAVIGIGLNVLMRETGCSINQPWTSLYLIHREAVLERNRLAAMLLHALDEVLREFREHGFTALADEWMASDAWRDQLVQVNSGAVVKTGLACGVDASGNLLLQTQSGIERIAGGEVSLRAINAAGA